MNRPLASPGGRYTITREIAAGGMATVYLGRLAGPGGFSRLVAIKRPHPHVAKLPEFCAMLLDEGRLAASISHPNVVSTLDVVAEDGDLFLVMEYVPGETLAQIARALRTRGETMPPRIACAIAHGVLRGLAAVHDARAEDGRPLGIVHRDISPQNILVGRDGVPRILDFGVAKAAGRLQVTREGQLKGKIAYMAPEQMRGNVTNRTDVFATAIVLWEALTGRRLFAGSDDVEVFAKVLTSRIAPPSECARGPSSEGLAVEAWTELDAVVLRGLARDPDERFASAAEMADALDRCLVLSSAAEIHAWLTPRIESDESAAREEEGAPGASSEVTVKEGGSGSSPDTWTKSGLDALALRVRDDLGSGSDTASAASAPSSTPHASGARITARAAAPKRAPMVAGGLFLLAISAVTFALTRSHPRADAPAASASVPVSGVGAVRPPDAPSSSIPQGASSTTPPVSNAPDDVPPPRAHGKPPARNRPDHARVPVPSQGIDVSHAIDQRH